MVVFSNLVTCAYLHSWGERDQLWVRNPVLAVVREFQTNNTQLHSQAHQPQDSEHVSPLTTGYSSFFFHSEPLRDPLELESSAILKKELYMLWSRSLQSMKKADDEVSYECILSKNPSYSNSIIGSIQFSDYQFMCQRLEPWLERQIYNTGALGYLESSSYREQQNVTHRKSSGTIFINCIDLHSINYRNSAHSTKGMVRPPMGWLKPNSSSARLRRFWNAGSLRHVNGTTYRFFSSLQSPTYIAT